MNDFVGDVGEWDMSSGDLKEHKVFDDAVFKIALSGDRMVTSGDDVIRAFSVFTCLLMLPSCFFLL